MGWLGYWWIGMVFEGGGLWVSFVDGWMCRWFGFYWIWGKMGLDWLWFSVGVMLL